MTERDGKERAAKLIAWRGLCSRREAERLIIGGQVTVDGVVLKDPGQRVGVDADIVIAGKGQERLNRHATVLLHKPLGIVSTQPEGDQTPAWKLLRSETCTDASAEGVEAVLAKPWTCAVCGRLDQDSRGLLVLSQDGRLAKRITGGHDWEKEYRVVVDRTVDRDDLKALRRLRHLDDQEILPMDVEATGADTLRFVLRQGRKRQIRRACAAIGLTVTDLLRLRIGPWTLDDLGEGWWRTVPRAEVDRALVPDETET